MNNNLPAVIQTAVKDEKAAIGGGDLKRAAAILRGYKRRALMTKSAKALENVNHLIKVFVDLSAGGIEV